jgi:hypothetical protein
MDKQIHDALQAQQYFLNDPLPFNSPSGWLSAVKQQVLLP